MKRILLSLLFPAFLWGQSVTLDSEWVGASSSELTISTGAVTATGTVHTIDTESDASSDDLDTITQASSSYTFIIVSANNSARDVVLKHGTGNLSLSNDADITLDTALRDWVMLRYEGSTWYEFMRSNTLGGVGGSATGFFSSGTIEHERGGLEADVSSYSGLVAISGGTTTEADTYKEVYDLQSDKFETSITAFATGGQGSATSLTNQISVVTVIASDGDSVKLPALSSLSNGQTFVVKNRDASGGNSLDVFPNTNDALGDLADNTAQALAATYDLYATVVDGVAWDIRVEEAETQVVSILVFDDSEDTAVADGAGDIFWRVPSKIDGWNLTAVAAQVQTAGTTGTTDIQIHNVTDTADMLSTKITIDTTETDSSTAATPAVINTATDDVSTGDSLRIDVDAVSTTAAKGLLVELTFTEV